MTEISSLVVGDLYFKSVCVEKGGGDYMVYVRATTAINEVLNIGRAHNLTFEC